MMHSCKETIIFTHNNYALAVGILVGNRYFCKPSYASFTV